MREVVGMEAKKREKRRDPDRRKSLLGNKKEDMKKEEKEKEKGEEEEECHTGEELNEVLSLSTKMDRERRKEEMRKTAIRRCQSREKKMENVKVTRIDSSDKMGRPGDLKRRESSSLSSDNLVSSSSDSPIDFVYEYFAKDNFLFPHSLLATLTGLPLSLSFSFLLLSLISLS